MFAISKTFIWSIAAFALLLATAVATTTFWILLSQRAATAGILTLNFNHTSTPSTSSSSPALLQRGLLQHTKSWASGVLDAIATNTPDPVGNVSSAVRSAAASLSEIEDYMPLNCSVGMIRFCVGFTHRQFCSSSRLTLSALVPDKIQVLPGPLRDAIQARAKELSPLSGLSRIPTAVVSCLFVGSLSMFTLLLLSFCVAYERPSCISRIAYSCSTKKQMLVHFGLGMACCSPYLALVAVQYGVIRAVEELPACVQAEAGEVFGVSIATAVFAIVFAALLVVLVGWSRVQRGTEASMSRRPTYALTRATGASSSEATV